MDYYCSMVVEEAYRKAREQLQDIYGTREAAQLTDMLIENICGLTRTQRIIQQKNINLSPVQQQTLLSYLQELLAHRPVQYVLHEAWFADKKFYVDENVLIPRPETEELCEWIISDYNSFKTKSSPVILDVGTGSGCIAITLKNKIPSAEIFAADISPGALQVAEKNASAQNAHIHFCEMNFLDRNEWSRLPQFDIIVSNPPYIKKSEAAAMQENVLSYEPHTALFVENDDACIFYSEIALFAAEHLYAGGRLYFEINEAHAGDVRELLQSQSLDNIELRQDMYGKNRMMRCERKTNSL